MTEQEQVDAEFDRKSKRNHLLGWFVYLAILGVMVFTTLKGCN